MKDEKMIRFCQDCGSTNVKGIDTDETFTTKVICMDCLYKGTPLEGSEEFRQEYLKRIEKKERK
ncbi:MAG: hypothetical protein V1847_03515 [Candidatus Diapherotrites archaeon]